ncbi:MAG: hypothetical protein ACM31L_19625 [Actinomycetota bacterium]
MTRPVNREIGLYAQAIADPVLIRETIAELRDMATRRAGEPGAHAFAAAADDLEDLIAAVRGEVIPFRKAG